MWLAHHQEYALLAALCNILLPIFDSLPNPPPPPTPNYAKFFLMSDFLPVTLLEVKEVCLSF